MTVRIQRLRKKGWRKPPGTLNRWLRGGDFDCGERHGILVDASGGRGISPVEWVRPPTDKRVGFAGGLGPDNLEQELPRILDVSRFGDWIDMETGLRDDDDWFDVERARAVLEIVQRLDP
jgi:phosphoribosylanthranilate isomerase